MRTASGSVQGPELGPERAQGRSPAGPDARHGAAGRPGTIPGWRGRRPRPRRGPCPWTGAPDGGWRWGTRSATMPMPWARPSRVFRPRSRAWPRPRETRTTSALRSRAVSTMSGLFPAGGGQDHRAELAALPARAARRPVPTPPPRPRALPAGRRR